LNSERYLVFAFVGGTGATAAWLGRVWKASIHCKHSCERRSAAEDDVGKTKAHGPRPHQRNRSGKSRRKSNGNDKYSDGTYALSVEHAEAANDPTESGDENHGD